MNYTTTKCWPVTCVLDKIYTEQSRARVQTVPAYLTIQQEGVGFSLPATSLFSWYLSKVRICDWSNLGGGGPDPTIHQQTQESIWNQPDI